MDCMVATRSMRAHNRRPNYRYTDVQIIPRRPFDESSEKFRHPATSEGKYRRSTWWVEKTSNGRKLIEKERRGVEEASAGGNANCVVCILM